MKFPIPAIIVTALLLATPVSALADELTSDSIQGSWMFTHIVMDGSREMAVDNPVEFLPDGTAVFYQAPGVERDRGTWEISGNSIIFTDKKGEQVWKLVSLENGKLHVDHKGAEMFFERPQ